MLSVVELWNDNRSHPPSFPYTSLSFKHRPYRRMPPEKTFPFRICGSASGGKKGERLSSIPMIKSFNG